MISDEKRGIYFWIILTGNLIVTVYPLLLELGFREGQVGHAAHKAFLGSDILIFEDLALSNITGKIKQVIALPLRLNNCDGAPCSILAFCE